MTTPNCRPRPSAPRTIQDAEESDGARNSVGGDDLRLERLPAARRQRWKRTQSRRSGSSGDADRRTPRAWLCRC